MANCKNCGSELNPNAKFCEFCGTRVETEESPAPAVPIPQERSIPRNEVPPVYQEPYREPYQETYTYRTHTNIAPRSIVLALILSFVTCGIYNIYWMIKINDEINELAGEPGATSGGMVFLFSLITCGIYGIYWMYKMGDRCDTIKGNSGSSGILFLILSLFGFGIISYCLMQDTVNKAVS